MPSNTERRDTARCLGDGVCTNPRCRRHGLGGEIELAQGVRDNRYPGQLELLRFFEYSHLPDGLQETSRSFYLLAHELYADDELFGAELTTALRKLLEAKDCAVRARIR